MRSGYEILDGDVERDRSAVLGLGERNLPRFAAERFATYYERSPYGRPLFQVAVTASGEAIGMAALFPARLWIDGALVEAAVAGDFAVDPRHRAFGPALRLQQRLLERAGAAGIRLAFGIPNGAAAPLLHRVGYRQVGSPDVFVKALRIGPALRRYARDPRALRLAAQLPGSALWSLRRVGRRRRALEEPPAFDARFAGLLASARGRARVVPERSVETLNWKFAVRDGRAAGGHAIAALAGADAVSAYGVVADDERVHRIVDIAYDDARDLDALVGGILRRAEARQAIAVTLSRLGEDAVLRGVLKRYGFVQEPDSVALNVVALPGASPPDAVFRPEHWSLLPGDVDV